MLCRIFAQFDYLARGNSNFPCNVTMCHSLGNLLCFIVRAVENSGREIRFCMGVWNKLQNAWEQITMAQHRAWGQGVLKWCFLNAQQDACSCLPLSHPPLHDKMQCFGGECPPPPICSVSSGVKQLSTYMYSDAVLKYVFLIGDS